MTTQRDPFIDNAKVALIVLVVLGHLLEEITLGSADTLYKWIYLFHIPAFVVISGYLSRSFRATPRQCLSLVTTLLIPYGIIQTLLAVERVLQGHHFSLNFFVPGFAIWYILALVVWRLATPLLKVIPHPLLVSVVISIVSVTYGGIGADLSGARILSFLPFFTLGLVTTPEHVEAFKRVTRHVWVRVAAGAFLLLALVVVYLSHDHFARAWLYMYGKYDKFGLSNLENILVRVVVLMAATAMLLAVLALIPQRKTIFSALGSATIYVYLLQTIIIYPLLSVIGAWDHWTVGWMLVLLLGGVALALALGTRPVRWATRWLIDPVNASARLSRYFSAAADRYI